jgi:hypothetical protein
MSDLNARYPKLSQRLCYHLRDLIKNYDVRMFTLSPWIVFPGVHGQTSLKEAHGREILRCSPARSSINFVRPLWRAPTNSSISGINWISSPHFVDYFNLVEIATGAIRPGPACFETVTASTSMATDLGGWGVHALVLYGTA